jgi:hypothetical protein
MTGVLIDSSVWISHFKSPNTQLAELIGSDLALSHPMVLLEIACGTPPAPRQRTLRDLGRLRTTLHASLPESLDWVEREALFGLGCGLVDIVLLVSTLITPSAQIWTFDKKLDDLAKRYRVSFESSKWH